MSFFLVDVLVKTADFYFVSLMMKSGKKNPNMNFGVNCWYEQHFTPTLFGAPGCEVVQNATNYQYKAY